MSAPRTNLDKQKRHHLIPVLGIVAVVLIALAGFVWWFDDETSDPEIPGQVPGPVDEMPADPPAAATGTEPAAGAGGEAASQPE